MAEREDELLRAVALQNAQSILIARRRAEEELLEAKEALERKAEDLYQQREWFRVTLSSIGDAVITTDTCGNVTFLNPVAELMTGWSAAEAAGKSLAEIFTIVHEETRRPAPNPVEAVLRDGIIVALANHTALIARNGSEVLIEDSAAPIKDAAGTLLGAVIVFHDVTGKRRAQAALHRSERELSEFFENASVAVHRVALDGTILRANRAALEQLGYAQAEYVGQHFAKCFVDAPVIEGILQKLGRGEVVENHEARLRARDGSIKHVVISCNALWEGGKFVHAHCFTRDVTEQKRAEAALRSAESRKASILDATLDAMFTIDHEGRIADLNLASERVLGYRRADAAGMHIRELIGPDRFNEEPFEHLMRYLKGSDGTAPSKMMELQIKRADGREFPAELSVSRVSEQEPPLFSASVHDISEGAHAQLLEMRLAAIVENSEDAIIGKTLEGIVTSWNRGAQSILGYTAEEMIGEPITAIIPPELRAEEIVILGRLARGERVENYETTRVTKHGQRIDVSLTSSPIRDARGRIVGTSKIARDISLRKRTDATLKKHAEEREFLLDSERSARNAAERMSEMKDEFLATLSHELRTPLSSILGWTHVLKSGIKSEADLQKGLEVIDRNARMQAQLIEDLLDMSRIVSGKVRLDAQPVAPISVVEAAMETVRPAANGKGVRLESRLDENAGTISGDPGRLQQVVWNLLSNAIKFTPKDGTVLVTLARTDSFVRISVADTGSGIKAEFLPYVFERFRQGDASTTRNYGGLGLGLAIVKQLVELHGGTVHAESDGEGKGATFSVQLPISMFREASGTRAQSSTNSSLRATYEFRPVNLSGIRVLIVDDVADARELMKRMLVECGADVLTAASAEEGLSVIQAASPDVLVSDVGMPNVDGFELVRRVRALGDARGGGVPAIALTAFARTEDRIRALRAGFQVHLAKPVEPSELIATVASVAGGAHRFRAKT